MYKIYSGFVPVYILIEILVAQFLFTLKADRRKAFFLRYIGYGMLGIFIVVWVIIGYSLITGRSFDYGVASGSAIDSIFNFIFYLLIFVMSAGIGVLSYKTSLSHILFCCSGAYAIQHISRNLTSLIVNIFGMDVIRFMWLEILFDLVFFAGLCVLMYFTLIRNQSDHAFNTRNQRAKLIVSLVVIFVCIGMSRLTTDNADRTLLALISENIYAIVCCLLILYVQYGLSENDTMKDEMENMQSILREAHKQYELSRENIDLINIKCHDLKHQISALRRDASAENISEIEHAVMIYDSSIKTGNEVLDVILTEKKLQCESKKIELTCVAHGELIGFMDQLDIYALFGNILSNAIESVAKIPNEQMRCIGINVFARDKMLMIHSENPYQGGLKFSNGLPVSESDSAYHGFGMKSIQRIAKKYGGELAIIADGSTFSLDIFIPLS